MRPSILAPLLPLLCLAALATASPLAAERPRLVRVALGPRVSVTTLLERGFQVVGVEGDRAAKVLAWPHEEPALAGLGAFLEVIDADPGATAALRAWTDRAAHPANAVGSMGGYRTTAEIAAKLQALVAGDPADVVADRIDTLGVTWQGRPIWGLALGKHVEGVDPRPVAFFNALTHACEPVGMEAILHFADDLLTRYGNDPFATYLLDHRVIYLAPLVNPDGYAVNEGLYASSGGTTFGMWRKNARDNNHNGRFDLNRDGVDLNRNYAFRWAKDNSGSSGNTSSSAYRGPAPFSEPETQSQRDLFVSRHPVTALSFHSFSDLLFHPWGHTDSLAPHVEAFHEWSDEINRENAYQSGGGALGLYLVNGDFADWCYGDTLLKPRAFAWTPEIGSDHDGFYPPPSRVAELVQENLRSCYVAAALAGPFVQEDGVAILEGAMNAGRLTRLAVCARHLGATGTAGPGLAGTLQSLDPAATVLVDRVAYPDLGPRTSADAAGWFEIAVDDTVTAGRTLAFAIDFTDDAGLFSRDTITVPVGTPTWILEDDGSTGLQGWSPGTWGIVADDPAHPGPYFTDSPAGDYGAAVQNTITLTPPLDLAGGVHAHAFYQARWEIEKNFDAATIEASLDGGSWSRLWATGTTPGSGPGSLQTAGDPFYAGTRWTWKPERADLSALTGAAASAVRLRFRLLSNEYLQFGGFSFDDLRIALYEPAAQPPPLTEVTDARLGFALDPIAPNPGRERRRLAFTLPAGGLARLEIFDPLGRRVAVPVAATLPAGRYATTWSGRDARGLAVPPGVYLARLATASGFRTRRFVVTR